MRLLLRAGMLGFAHWGIPLMCSVPLKDESQNVHTMMMMMTFCTVMMMMM